ALRLPAAGSRRVAAGSRWVIIAFFIMVVLPTELSINIFDATIYPARLYLLCMFVPALIKIFKDRTLHLFSFDYFLICYALWLWLAIVINHDVAKGLYFGGSLTVEAIGSYIVARAFVRNFGDFLVAVRTYFTTVVVVAALAIPESLTGFSITHEVLY